MRQAPDDRLIVGSEVGVTLPVGDTTAHIRFSFWSERFTKDGTLTEIRKTAKEVDEFNEEQLERYLEKYMKTIARALRGGGEDPGNEQKVSGRVSVRDRAKAKVKK